MANDIDPDGDLLGAYLVSAPAVGTLGFHQDGGFNYDAPIGFTGEVTFVYKASQSDYRFKDEALVTLVVQ